MSPKAKFKDGFRIDGESGRSHYIMIQLRLNQLLFYSGVKNFIQLTYRIHTLYWFRDTTD